MRANYDIQADARLLEEFFDAQCGYGVRGNQETTRNLAREIAFELGGV